ncbi:MAG: DUF1648 domain-containing protein [Candidatus Krumholzibacteriia bacterium]
MPLPFFRAGGRRRARLAALPADVRAELNAAPPSPLAMPLLAGAVVGVALAIGLALFAWTTLPDRIPSHFGSDGRPDAWGGRSTLFIFPFMTLFLFGMMTLLTRSPATYNYPFAVTRVNARRQATLAMGLVAWLRFATIWLMTYLEYGVIAAARNTGATLGFWFLPVVLLLIAAPVIGYFVAAWRGR